jgi:transcriptional repressor NrdR
MHCPFCGGSSTRVIDTTRYGDYVRRRRECLSCSQRFSTIERAILPAPPVVKRDGRREQFSREKVLSGLRAATARRPVSSDELERLVARVEHEIVQMGKSEVSSRTIGDLAMRELKRLDPVSYIRYATVYLRLSDLEAVRAEIDRLVEGQDWQSPS